MQTQSEIAENDVFVSRWTDPETHRRVVAIHKGIIVYCKGGDKSYCCKLKTFVRWIKRHEAEKKLQKSKSV